MMFHSAPSDWNLIVRGHDDAGPPRRRLAILQLLFFFLFLVFLFLFVALLFLVLLFLVFLLLLL